MVSARECAKYLIYLYVLDGNLGVAVSVDESKGLDELCTYIDKYIVKDAYIRCEESKRTIISCLGEKLIQDCFEVLEYSDKELRQFLEYAQNVSIPNDEDKELLEKYNNGLDQLEARLKIMNKSTP